MRGVIGTLADATWTLHRAARLERARRRAAGETVDPLERGRLNLDPGPATEEERRRPVPAPTDDTEDVEEITPLQALIASQVDPTSLRG